MRVSHRVLRMFKEKCKRMLYLILLEHDAYKEKVNYLEQESRKYLEYRERVVHAFGKQS